MHLLAIETSCDETAAAVLKDGEQLLSSIVLSQEEIHSSFGGIVPELACRRHIQVISQVVRSSLEKGGITVKEIDGIAVTSGPGLIGALLVGVSYAKGLAYARRIPLVAVNHLEGHLWAVALRETVLPPFVALVVSGGHTQIYHVRSFGEYELLGGTLDDAAGEVFDKVSRILGLGFPGGPAIEKVARQGDPKRFSLPRGLNSKLTYDFSFSGLKTAVLRQMKEIHGPTFQSTLPFDGKDDPRGEQFVSDMASGFQEAVVDVLVSKTLAAALSREVSHIVVSGGVACNQLLRSRMRESAKPHSVSVHFPEPAFCTDNAAMIGWVGYQYYLRGKFAPLDLNPQARLSLVRA